MGMEQGALKGRELVPDSTKIYASVMRPIDLLGEDGQPIPDENLWPGDLVEVDRSGGALVRVMDPFEVLNSDGQLMKVVGVVSAFAPEGSTVPFSGYVPVECLESYDPVEAARLEAEMNEWMRDLD